jgi:hypothetical protein
VKDVPNLMLLRRSSRLRVLSLRTRTTFPSSAFEGHFFVIGAGVVRGGDPSNASDRPRPSLLWRPAKGDTVRKIEVPSTVATRML